MCRPKGLKTGIDFAHFGLESGMIFEGTTGVYECIYRFSPKWIRKKEKYATSRPHEFRSEVWKRVWILEARSENGCENDIFWSEIGSCFGEPGYTPPQRIPRSAPR